MLVAEEFGQTCPTAADLAARGKKARGREAKEETEEMRDDVVAIERLTPASVAQSRERHATPREDGRSSLEIGVGRGIGKRLFLFVGDGEEGCEVAEVRRILMLPTFLGRCYLVTCKLQPLGTDRH